LPLLLPDVPAAPTAAPNAIARTAPTTMLPAVNEDRVLDPNGSVTLRVITDAQRAGRLASGLSDRYRVQPDRLPRLTASLIVPYPSAARQARSSARIAALIDVDEQGRIAGTRLVPDDATFAASVMEALKDARFAPAEVATHPVPYWAVLEFDFAIPAR
jgi:TonB family protein